MEEKHADAAAHEGVTERIRRLSMDTIDRGPATRMRPTDAESPVRRNGVTRDHGLAPTPSTHFSQFLAMAHAFFLGVDVGTAANGSLDATLSMLEKEKESSEGAARYRLNHIRHHTDVADADALADHIQSFVADKPYIGRTNIIVHRGPDPGQALIEALKNRGLDPVAATLTVGSGTVSGETDEVGVTLGTADAVRTLAELHRDGLLTIDDHTTEAGSELARGVQRASEALDAADGNQDTPEAAGSRLDVLDDVDTSVRSAALAAWCGTERSFDPSQHLKEDPQTGRPNGA